MKSSADRDLVFYALLAACALNVAILAPRLLVSDFNLEYPFLEGDGWDWIANGLWWGGADVRFSARPPLVPLLMALLERGGVLRLWPVWNLILLHATGIVFYRVVRSRCGRSAALIAAVVVLFGFSVQSVALHVAADLTAGCLLFLSTACFLAALSRPRHYVGWGALAGLSAVAQQAALLVPLPAVLILLWRRRGHLRHPAFWLGLAAFAAPPLLWSAYKWHRFGTVGDVLAVHWGLLRPHDSSGFFLWSTASLLGLPAALGVFAGAVVVVRSRATTGDRLFPLALAATLFGFFAFCYDYNAKRFLLYGVWLAGLLLAELLARLPAAARAAVGCLCVATAAMPLPAPGNDAGWVALWPAPPLFLEAPSLGAANGSRTLQIRRARVRRSTVGALAANAIFARVSSSREAPLVPTALPPEALRGDRAALFLFRSPEDGGGSYRIETRLGNAVGHPALFLPRAWLSRHRCRLSLEPLGRLGRDYEVARGRFAELPETWLVVTPPGDGFGPDCGMAASGAEGLARARQIRAALSGSDAYVAIVPDAGSDSPVELFLPLLLDRSELRIIEPSAREEAFAFLGRLPNRGERRIGDAFVRYVRIFGRPSAVVSFVPWPDKQ